MYMENNEVIEQADGYGTQSRLYNEYYGTVTLALWNAIKEHNVSPADYDHIVSLFEYQYGILEDYEYDDMVDHIKSNLIDNMYYPPLHR